MLRNLGFSTLSNASRFLASGLLFILLAALLPPDVFGRLVFHNIVAVLAAMAMDYGIPVKTMRDVGASRKDAGRIVAESLKGQLWLLLPSGLIGAGAWVCGFVMDLALFALLWLAHLAFNLVSTAVAALRGLHRFRDEACVALIGNALFLAVPVALILSGFGVHAVAAGMAAARLVQGMVAGPVLGRALQAGGLPWRPQSNLRVLREARPYALETAASGLFQQADSLVVRIVLGEAALGLYQAGARLVAISIVLVQSLGNFLVPTLASAIGGDRFRHALVRSARMFAALGLACFAGIGVLGGPVVDLLYGADYGELAGLMPLFGLVALLRCLAAGQGIALLALGHQGYRFRAVLATAAIFVPAGLAGAVLAGLAGVLLASATSILALAGIYRWRIRRDPLVQDRP